MKKAISNFFRELLEMLFQAASLTIDTIRTFFLIVLAILGPISFAISVWDGFRIPSYNGYAVTFRLTCGSRSQTFSARYSPRYRF